MNWKEAALAHAKDQDPDESCGLLLNIRGKERYYPCRNLSAQSDEYFILDPEDYIKGSNLGTITAIIHSHPDTPPVASQADKMSCEQSKLPWHIVNPKTETWGYYEPCGYKAPLLGRPWVWAVTDCWSLIVDWYKEERGIELLDYERPTRIEEFTDDPVFERCAWRTGFRQLRPEEKLQSGDVLLMSMLDSTLNHVSIFLGDEVLHHLTDRLSCREPYNPWLLKCTGGRYRYDA